MMDAIDAKSVAGGSASNSKSNVASFWVRRDSLAMLLVAQSVAILPLFFNLPKWLPLVWFGVLLCRIQIFRGAWVFPSTKIKLSLGAICVLGLWLSYSGKLGVEPLIGFLVISFLLKLLEVKSLDDALVVIYVAFVAVAVQFIFYQTVFISLYALLSVLVIVAAWNSIHRSRSLSFSRLFGANFWLLLQSIPIMLVLFLVLPRMGSLWHVPLPKSTGTTGFSDRMSPGDFSALSQSREVAFRVSFQAPERIPPRAEWYWRGLVLDQFDGRGWAASNRFTARTSAGDGVPESWNLVVDPFAEPLRYRVMLEPHQQPWLFTLMAPVFASSSAHRVYFSADYLTQVSRPISSRTQYSVASATQFAASPTGLSAESRSLNTYLPKQINPRAQALAQGWRTQGMDDKQMIEAALDLYRASFTYTMQPPALGRHSVDEFLFETQRGFCEHFSSSFVTLMRAAGIPARVVVGYQGGESSPVENYIIVRQSDAHAWAEVWLADQGWVLVDPTAAVSPLRIEQGLEDSLSADERGFIKPLFSGAALNLLALRLDALSFSWHQWVLGYDAEKQAGFFQRVLGAKDAWRVALFFVSTVGLFLFVYFLVLVWRGRKINRYPENAAWHSLLKNLQKRGHVPTQGETPGAFLQRVVKVEKPRYKSDTKELLRIAALFERVAYAEDKNLTGELLDAVQRFNRRLMMG